MGNDLAKKLEEKKEGAVSTRKNGGGLTKAQTIEKYLSSPDILEKIAKVLPQHMDPVRFGRTTYMTISENPQLMTCDVASLIRASIKCAQIGLEPNILGHMYLVPFWNGKKKCHEVQTIIGYRGMIELARRSGSIKEIYAELVYENDYFVMNLGSERNIEHVPAGGKGGFPRKSARGNLVGVYAVAKFKDGGQHVEVMDIDEVEERKARSKAASAKFSPWTTDYEAMVRKTIIRKLFNLLPISSEISRSVREDSDSDESNPPRIVNEDSGFGDLPPLNYTEEPEADEAEDAEIIDTETGEIKEEKNGPPPADQTQEPAQEVTAKKSDGAQPQKKQYPGFDQNEGA